MLFLISPAKSLNFDPVSKTLQDLALKQKENFASKPIFSDEANKLAYEMQKFSIAEIQELMSISQNLALLNYDRFKNFDFTQGKQALMAFDGDVYSEIERKSLKISDFKYLQQHLRIISGLYGILRPFDLIKPHRLEMGTSFKNYKFLQPNLLNLHGFWQDKITDEINKTKVKTVINLASSEYFQAINPKKLQAKLINIEFKEKIITEKSFKKPSEKTSKEAEFTFKTIGISAKKARGAMVNFANQQKIQNFEDLKSFKEKGYNFNQELSNQQKWVFTR